MSQTLETLSDDTRKNARHLLAEAQRAIHNSDSKGVMAALAELTELGIDAIPPAKHQCAFCNHPGQLYCYATAVNRARGII